LPRFARASSRCPVSNSCPSNEIADQAARIRAATNLQLPDAIHIATALVAGAEAFLTNDRQLLRAADELPILILDHVVGTPPALQPPSL